MEYRLHYFMYAAGALLALLGYALLSVVVLVGAVVVHHQTRMEQQRQRERRRASLATQDSVQLSPLPQPDEHLEEKEDEEFTFSVPESSEHGWNRLTVYPAKRRYEQIVCFGGPPTWFTVGEYDIRVEGMKVFVRVVEQRRDDLSVIRYEMVNGTVLRQRQDETYASMVAWHELTRPEKYFILSRHVKKDLLVRERERLQKGFAALKAAAEGLGAVSVRERGFNSYEAPEGATEEQKTTLGTALDNLLSATGLERYGISRDEFYCLLDLLWVLDEILDQGSQRQADREL